MKKSKILLENSSKLTRNFGKFQTNLSTISLKWEK